MKYLIFVILLMGTAFLILLSGFTLPTEVALLILILAIASDFYTTWRCLRRGRREGNPMAAFLFRKVGVYKSFGLLAGIWVIIIMFRFLPATEGIQTAIALVYWVVPVNNLIVLMKSRRKSYA